MNVLFHITTREQWLAAETAGVYRSDSLKTEGFIHCSTIEQVAGVANAKFQGCKGLVLLVIDPALVTAEIRFEDCYDTGRQFPHIYGALPVSAVIDVIDYPTETDGLFHRPVI